MRTVTRGNPVDELIRRSEHRASRRDVLDTGGFPWIDRRMERTRSLL